MFAYLEHAIFYSQYIELTGEYFEDLCFFILLNWVLSKWNMVQELWCVNGLKTQKNRVSHRMLFEHNCL